MSGFELFGSTRARTCVISALDHYPHNSFDDGFQFNRSSRDSHFAIDRDISTTYCWLSSNYLAIYCAELLVNVAPWVPQSFVCGKYRTYRLMARKPNFSVSTSPPPRPLRHRLGATPFSNQSLLTSGTRQTQTVLVNLLVFIKYIAHAWTIYVEISFVFYPAYSPLLVRTLNLGYTVDVC